MAEMMEDKLIKNAKWPDSNFSFAVVSCAACHCAAKNVRQSNITEQENVKRSCRLVDQKKLGS